MEETFTGGGEGFIDRVEVIFQRLTSIQIDAAEQFEFLRLKLPHAALQRSDARSKIRRLHRFGSDILNDQVNISFGWFKIILLLGHRRRFIREAESRNGFSRLGCYALSITFDSVVRV